MRTNEYLLTNRFFKVVMILGMFLIAVSFAGADTTGTLSLQGTVPGILEIAVTPEAVSSALDLSLDTAGVKVATVLERSNKKDGYTVTMESANAAAASSGTAFFANIDPAVASNLDYQITYDGNPLTLTNGSAVISDVAVKTNAAGTSREVNISYNGASDFPYEGTYTDVLTFTIAAK